MGKKAEVHKTEDDIIDEIDTEVEVEETETEEEIESENSNDSEEEVPESEKDSEDDGNEVIVTIGDEAPPQEDEQSHAPEWVRELRKSHRETQKENRELRDRLKALENPEPKTVQVGKKPALDDPGIDYDTDKYEQELAAWYEQKRKADEVAAQQKAEQQKAEDAWKQKLNEYGDSKAKLKVKDFDDAEAVVIETFSQTQQGIIVQGADNAALVIYALGKNSDRAKELASIKDPVKFAFAVAKLEKDLKVKNRKAPPPPEKKVDGTGPKSGTIDSTLERLRVEAAKTGNYDKVMAYRRKQKAKD